MVMVPVIIQRRWTECLQVTGQFYLYWTQLVGSFTQHRLKINFIQNQLSAVNSKYKYLTKFPPITNLMGVKYNPIQHFVGQTLNYIIDCEKIWKMFIFSNIPVKSRSLKLAALGNWDFDTDKYTFFTEILIWNSVYWHQHS